MATFNIVRKGYDILQVDEHLNNLVKFTESKLLEHKKRIDLLKDENKQLQLKIEGYEKQADSVSEALINATKKANEIINASKMRFALEGERLKIMRAKWTKYVENASDEVYKLDSSINMQAYLTKMDDELRQMIGEDLNIKKARILNDAEEQFMSERNRLSSLDNAVMTDSEEINDKKITIVQEGKKELKTRAKRDIKQEITDSVLNRETIADKEDDYVGKVKRAYTNNIKQAIIDYEKDLDNEIKEDDDISEDEIISSEERFDINEALNPEIGRAHV